ncbi:unnamed protein product [Colias eurytheme]|nr:unnamed protein product [Colias eurytheme]
MNFIQDAGMVFNFDSGVWFMRHDKVPQSILFENRTNQSSLYCSSVSLREDEGSHLNSDERDALSHLLSKNEDIFTPGGGPTEYAIHRIDTGDAAPVASPPYRVTPAKKENLVADTLSQSVTEDTDNKDSEEIKLVVPESLRDELMREFHDSPTAGHMGVERTLTYVTQYIKSLPSLSHDGNNAAIRHDGNDPQQDEVHDVRQDGTNGTADRPGCGY